MAIFSYCIIGFLLSLAIARYEQSDKLFWVFFMSFVTGIAGGSLIFGSNSNEEEEKTVVINNQETSAISTAPSICLLAVADEIIEAFEQKQMSIHKNDCEITTETILEVNQGIILGYMSNHLKPILCTDILTPVDLLNNCMISLVQRNHL